MIALLCFLLRLLVSPFKSTTCRLEAENAALRHQLIALRSAKSTVALSLRTAIVSSSSCCIDGFRRSSIPSQSSGPRRWCAGIVPGFVATGAGSLGIQEVARQSCAAHRRDRPVRGSDHRLYPALRPGDCPLGSARACLDQRTIIGSSRSRSPLEHGEGAVLVEVSLERASSSHVQGNAMGPAPEHFGVTQFYSDDVEPFLLQ